ncbi:MAG: putative anti-sigma regulatory factor, serine/threonine protein kinase [Candidatus Solibacter sp.]|jgi:anti-sigma regulatory factor (Ser/Thr protein kinase)|nr:putative anti-sigma regulatory factor, serine/threonine protein kinase [Candidatus Solibacter sp.]
MTTSEATAENLSMHVTFVMRSHPRYLAVVRATVGQLAVTAGLEDSESRALVLAIDEALANVIRHAYHGRSDQRIELECHAAAGELKFRIRDSGDPPDPTSIGSREIGCDQIGGLGTHIIRDVMDTVSYRTSPEGNCFTAAKRLRRQS